MLSLAAAATNTTTPTAKNWPTNDYCDLSPHLILYWIWIEKIENWMEQNENETKEKNGVSFACANAKSI